MGVFLPTDVDFDFRDCGYSSQKLLQTCSKLSKYQEELVRLVKNPDWEHPACSILLASDKKFLRQSQALVKKLPKPSLIIVVGIGGSNLGAMAIYRSIFGNIYSSPKNPQVLFADTVDPRSLQEILSVAKDHAACGGNIILNVISKSGRTLETIVNFDVIYSKLKRSAKGNLSVVAVTGEGSDFEKIATKEGFEILSIPKNVGGRYSVFSNVGLFVLSLCGINCSKLLEGAKSGLNKSLLADFRKNPAVMGASFLHLHKKRGRNIFVNFMFSNNLRALGYWYAQLLGESVGKEKNLAGTKIVREGITPLISVGTTDLHATGQLYFAGPDDKVYRFVSLADFAEEFDVGASELIKSCSSEAQGKKVSDIMGALCEGTKEAYRKRGMPFSSVRLAGLDEYSLGYYMQVLMVETMYVAKLRGVNAFDQPAVENYKLEAKRILKKI